MNKQLLYSRRMQIIIKITAFIAMLILFFANLGIIIYNDFFSLKLFQENFKLLSFYLNIISFILCLILFFKPVKIGIISIISFLYSYFILLFEQDNYMGILMYCLAISVLLLRGFFKKHKLSKIIFIFICFLIPFLLSFFISKTSNFTFILGNFAYIFINSIIFFFIQIYIYFEKTQTSNKILNLYNYKGLSKRDSIWLQEILNNKLYKEIAFENNLKVGTVKNRFKIIFETLQVGDKIGFINQYDGYKIVFIQPNDEKNISSIDN